MDGESRPLVIVYEDDDVVKGLGDERMQRLVRQWQSWVFARTGNAVADRRHNCMRQGCFGVRGRITRIHPRDTIFGCTVSGVLHRCQTGTGRPTRRNDCMPYVYQSDDGALRCRWSDAVVASAPMFLANKDEFTHETEVNTANETNVRIVNHHMISDDGDPACEKRPLNNPSPPPPAKRSKRRVSDESAPAVMRDRTQCTLDDTRRRVVRETVRDILYSPYVKESMGSRGADLPDALGKPHTNPLEANRVPQNSQTQTDAAYLRLVEYICARAVHMQNQGIQPKRLRSVAARTLYVVARGIWEDGLVVIPENKRIARALPDESELRWYGIGKETIKKQLSRRSGPTNQTYRMTAKEARIVRNALQDMSAQEIRHVIQGIR